MGSNIPLEGRTRLPTKIQDAVQDTGLIASHILNASRSNELLASAIKSVSCLDSILAHSTSNVQRLQQLLDNISAQCSIAENSVDLISDVQEQLHEIEKNRYYSMQPSARDNDDFSQK